MKKQVKKNSQIFDHENTYKEDYRQSNPSLHLLYVKQAVIHLTTINECIIKLDNLSNLNMTDILQAMWSERNKLISSNAAYADAQEIIDSIYEVSGEKEEE